MSDTLLLNTSGIPLSEFPVSVIDWKRAIKLMFLEKIIVLDYYDDWEINSPTTTINVPATVMVKDYLKVKHDIKFSRFNMALRDHFKCQYCNIEVDYENSTIDHVIPRSKGGKTTWDNVVTCCTKCNSAKGSRTDVKPRRTPTEPNYYQMAALRRRFPFKVRHESWHTYIPNSY
jgi:5-methylcytosine-specific restriction endonuclease McrA